MSESALAEPDGSTNNAVTVSFTTLIYLVLARKDVGRANWPDKAFETKEAAEAYAGTRNLAYAGTFYTVTPLTLARML